MTPQEQHDECRRRLPLPMGCTVARYVDGFREVAVYDITYDGFRCRHDWIDNEGNIATFYMPQHLDGAHTSLEALITERRAQAKELRNPTPDHHPV
jgi:hypothetical protein